MRDDEIFLLSNLKFIRKGIEKFLLDSYFVVFRFIREKGDCTGRSHIGVDLWDLKKDFSLFFFYEDLL